MGLNTDHILESPGDLYKLPILVSSCRSVKLDLLTGESQANILLKLSR